MGEPGPLGQSDWTSDWYSEGHGLYPRSSHISFVEIGHEIISMAILSLLLSDSSRAVVSYWGEVLALIVLVYCLGSLPRNSVDRLTDPLDMTLRVLTGP